MSLVGKLIGFGFRQVIGIVDCDDAAKVAGSVIQIIEQHFSDHSQTLPKALGRANDRAWQALSIALAGDGFLDKIKVFFASGDDKGIREQVRLFLQDKNICFEGTSDDFRKKCVTELMRAKTAGLLSAQKLIGGEVGKQAAEFQRYANPKEMADGADQVMGQIADDLAADFPNLGKLVQRPPTETPPLLVSAFAYFFRREVETDDELAHGLFFDGLRQLSASQAKAFGEVNKALISLGNQFEQVFQQLDRIETVVGETHGAVLDIQAELQRLGSLHLTNADQVRRLLEEVLNRVSQAGMQKGEVKPHHSFSIRSEAERNAVKQLLARFRQLPAQQQQQVPALLNGLGKLQFGSGDFNGARATFETVSQTTTDATAQAEAQFNAYRAALEEKKWDEALTAIQQAAKLDYERFAPFPMLRYVARKILGAGGFGTAFLCHDRHFDEEVVVKTLHDAAMERNMPDVFREARLLRKLNHSAIIAVRECDYAFPSKQARPYIVMDYFRGANLENVIQQGGTLSADAFLIVAHQIAQGMQAAHEQNILHRDLKPDNILVHKEGSNWNVKIIDFGIALRKQTIETSSDSMAGTVKYAPPEQMGEMKGIKPGPYSDVYAFGKMCCYALFKTTEPKHRHWASIAKELHEMLEGCTEQDLEHRLPSFEPVLKVLEGLNLIQARRKKEEEAQQNAEMERRNREQEEAEKKQQAEVERKRLEQEQAEKELSEIYETLILSESDPDEVYFEHVARTHGIDKERVNVIMGEITLSRLVHKVLDRTQGTPTKDDTAAVNEICKKHRIRKERANQLIKDVRKLRRKLHQHEEARQKDESERKRLELEEADRQRQELERLQKEGEIRLVQLIREALDRTQGKPSQEDTNAADEICKQHRIAWERAKQIFLDVIQQRERDNTPKSDRMPREIITNCLGVKFAWIPPGTFLMGSPKDEKDREGCDGADETLHQVTLSKGFYLGVHTITQEQWQVVMANNPSECKNEKNLPVEQVSWDDCQDFIKKMREKDKKPYRLPTEAEWEYACRAGMTTPFSFGETISTDQANYNGNQAYGNW